MTRGELCNQVQDLYESGLLLCRLARLAILPRQSPKQTRGRAYPPARDGEHKPACNELAEVYAEVLAHPHPVTRDMLARVQRGMPLSIEEVVVARAVELLPVRAKQWARFLGTAKSARIRKLTSAVTEAAVTTLYWGHVPTHEIGTTLGIRGMRGATLLALQQSLFSQFQKLIAGTPGAAAQQAAFAQTPLQEFEQLLARLQDIGNLLGTALLPELAVLLKYLDVLFGTIDRWLAKHSQAAKVAAAAAAGMYIGGPPGAVIGAGIGAGGAIVYEYATGDLQANTPEQARRNSVLVHNQGSGLAAAIYHRASPQGTHGDPLYVHPLGVPPAAPQITQNVTIHADGVTPQDVIRALREANQQFAEMVRLTTIQAFNQVQQHQKRRTFLDPGLGGAAP